jgi:peroxiredoxin
MLRNQCRSCVKPEEYGFVAEARGIQQIGQTLEDFSLQRVGAGMETLGQYLEGKRGAVVVFWSGVCSHCSRYDGYFNGFTNRHPELGLVTIACRQNETMDMIERTAAQRKLVFPILHDPESRIADRWFARQTPRVFLLDSSSVLRYRGAVDNFRYSTEPEYLEYLEPAISRFLAGEPLGRTETPSFGCDVKSVYYILPKML